MTNTRFDAVVDKLSESTTGNWTTGARFKISELDATLDELREVGTAYGLYLHHCSRCDAWYFAWYKTLEEAKRYSA